MKEKTMIRPTKEMTTTVIPREQLLALLQGDDRKRRCGPARSPRPWRGH
jgi:hypothetical protein